MKTTTKTIIKRAKETAKHLLYCMPDTNQYFGPAQLNQLTELVKDLEQADNQLKGEHHE